jgi:hypothetical protein
MKVKCTIGLQSTRRTLLASSIERTLAIPTAQVPGTAYRLATRAKEHLHHHMLGNYRKRASPPQTIKPKKKKTESKEPRNYGN